MCTGKLVTRRLRSGMLGMFVHNMANSEFWKLKQASRSGWHSYVSISEVRTLGTGLSRATSRQLA